MNWLRLHVSNLCNFKCPGCHVFELGENVLPNKVMNQDVFDLAVENFVSAVALHGSDPIYVSIYGGETLANKKVIKSGVEKFGRSHLGVPLKWVINTNGSLLNEEDILFFKEYEVEIHISVDGNEEIHNLSRPTHKGKGTFHMVVPALELIKKHYVPAQINSYMMPSNLHHLHDIVDIAHTYSIPKIYLDQFYNVEMVDYQEGLELYRKVHLYGMQKKIEVSGPWIRVLKNYLNQEDRIVGLKKTLSLDVNIDGTLYFPTLAESKSWRLTINDYASFVEEGGLEKVSQGIAKKAEKYCSDCSWKTYCGGLAIEQVQYHIGLHAKTKVSCDFFRDWMNFLTRPFYFESREKIDVLSVVKKEDVSKVIKSVEKEIGVLEKKLWPLKRKIKLHFVEYHEELLLGTKVDALPTWVRAITSGDSLFHKAGLVTPHLRHELTHIFFRQHEIKCPLWLEEGLCEWFQGNQLNQTVLAESIKRKINLMKIFSNQTEVFLFMDNNKPEQNLYYAQAYGFVLFLESQIGADLLKLALMESCEKSFENVLFALSGISLKEFYVEFQTSGKFTK